MNEIRKKELKQVKNLKNKMKECEQWIHNMNLSIIEKKKKCNRRARRTEKYLLKDMQYSEKKANALSRHDIFRCRMLKNREIKELI